MLCVLGNKGSAATQRLDDIRFIIVHVEKYLRYECSIDLDIVKFVCSRPRQERLKKAVPVTDGNHHTIA